MLNQLIPCMHTCLFSETNSKKSAKKWNLAIWLNPLKIGKMQTPQGKKTGKKTLGSSRPGGNKKSTKNTCPVLYSLTKTPHPTPHSGSYTRALLVSQDRLHLFVTPCSLPMYNCTYNHYKLKFHTSAESTKMMCFLHISVPFEFHKKLPSFQVHQFWSFGSPFNILDSIKTLQRQYFSARIPFKKHKIFCTNLLQKGL
jgi:hypothetical protein